LKFAPRASSGLTTLKSKRNHRRLRLQANFRAAPFCLALALAMLVAFAAKASPVVNLGHYYVRQGDVQSFPIAVADSGNAAAEDIEGMTYSLQIGAGTGTAPAISSINFLSSSIWTGHVSAANIVPHAGETGPQFKEFTLFTNTIGDFVNANGTLATLTLSAANASPADYALKMTGTNDPGNDSQFTDGLGEAVPAAFSSGTLTIVVSGDFNRDNQLTSADLDDMFLALTNKSNYESLRGVPDPGLLTIGDLNNDQSFNNLDIQAMLQLLNHPGGGQLIGVPEPSGLVLAIVAIGCAIAFWLRLRPAFCRRGSQILCFRPRLSQLPESAPLLRSGPSANSTVAPEPHGLAEAGIIASTSTILLSRTAKVCNEFGLS
jgi:hypothetical protein